MQILFTIRAFRIIRIITFCIIRINYNYDIQEKYYSLKQIANENT
ncbi:hypothetical protein TBC1_11443 [Lentimicrobium saccharophilum]|uniref:Uncharacterized protein n=1 Tax=Lentimicrobium saccharophilum TaxID=1678841 RepID=A0A0S7BP95_9BACT|nr:hypothetical protein TBC1_11443 [Lentimicrobium saccharophilum]